MRGSRGRCKTLDAVALAFGGVTNGCQRSGFACPGYALKRRDLIATAENLLYRPMLAAAEMRVVVLNLPSGAVIGEHGILFLGATHEAYIVVLQRDHLVRGKAPSNAVSFLLN